MRKLVGVSEKLHSELKELSDDTGLPMTVVLQSLISIQDQVDWGAVKDAYDRVKPTWKNIKRIVQEYREKYPKASDEELSKYTGFTQAQVETVTHTAHKRCIAHMKRNPSHSPAKVMKSCNVSKAFADRIWKQYHRDAKIPRGEQYLFNRT